MPLTRATDRVPPSPSALACVHVAQALVLFHYFYWLLALHEAQSVAHAFVLCAVHAVCWVDGASQSFASDWTTRVVEAVKAEEQFAGKTDKEVR